MGWEQVLRKTSVDDVLIKEWQESALGEDEHMMQVLRLLKLAATHARDSHPKELARETTEDVRRPDRVWSISISGAGDPRYRLRFPLTVMIEDYRDEFVCSWPEVETWGSGSTEAESINAFKDELVRLCDDLLGTPLEQLGKNPRRWLSALLSVIEYDAGEST
jgi:hypothetical protein